MSWYIDRNGRDANDAGRRQHEVPA
jgi:hypothetical protein